MAKSTEMGRLVRTDVDSVQADVGLVPEVAVSSDLCGLAPEVGSDPAWRSSVLTSERRAMLPTIAPLVSRTGLQVDRTSSESPSL